jgi:hypothetical protein
MEGWNHERRDLAPTAGVGYTAEECDGESLCAAKRRTDVRLMAVLFLVPLCLMAWPADDQAYLGIFAEIKVMKMPGVGDVADLSEIPKESLDKMPNIDLMMGKPEMSLNVRLWSPGLAPPDATTWLALPARLMQGLRPERLRRDLHRRRRHDDHEGLRLHAPPPGGVAPEVQAPERRVVHRRCTLSRTG